MTRGVSVQSVSSVRQNRELTSIQTTPEEDENNTRDQPKGVERCWDREHSDTKGHLELSDQSIAYTYNAILQVDSLL